MKFRRERSCRRNPLAPILLPVNNKRVNLSGGNICTTSLSIINIRKGNFFVGKTLLPMKNSREGELIYFRGRHLNHTSFFRANVVENVGHVHHLTPSLLWFHLKNLYQVQKPLKSFLRVVRHDLVINVQWGAAMQYNWKLPLQCVVMSRNSMPVMRVVQGKVR